MIIRALRIVRSAVFGLGLFSFGLAAVCTGLASAGMTCASSKCRLPLGTLISVVVDADGNTFCYDRSYYRVEVFGADGAFRRGWFAPNGTVVDADWQNGIVHMVFNRDVNRTYSLDGALKKEWIEDGSSKRRFENGVRPVMVGRGKNGKEYCVDTNPLYTKLSMVGMQRERVPLIQDPWYLQVIRDPFPAWAYLFVPILSWIIEKAIAKRRAAKTA